MILKQLFAWLTGGEVVILIDFDGERRFAVARTFGSTKYAMRMHQLCELMEDGSVKGQSYVTQWRKP